MNQIEIKISNEEISYQESMLFMESRVEDISKNKSQELLWFLNHNHIFTQGTSALKEEILNPNIIDVIKSNRGGKTTYHGPGQRIVYFMLKLNNKKFEFTSNLPDYFFNFAKKTNLTIYKNLKNYLNSS